MRACDAIQVLIESSGGRWGSGNGSEDLLRREVRTENQLNALLTLDDT